MYMVLALHSQNRKTPRMIESLVRSVHTLPQFRVVLKRRSTVSAFTRTVLVCRHYLLVYLLRTLLYPEYPYLEYPTL